MASAIRFENVSKKYILTQIRARSFQDAVLSWFGKKQPPEEQSDEFWVLKNLSFDIYQGETFSIVGANGAGKSTLLKLMTQIIRPTRGRITVTGRISALLELGAGFHPDLTGRENIYLTGALAGLSQTEVDENIEEIITFAGIDRFIDVPVSHYSSGMFVRLGFALATHISPDILIVDEVLAVGDASFQKKCLAKVHEMRRQKVTIIFISHDMSTVHSISDRVMWLKKGDIQAIGDSRDVIKAYLADQRRVYETERRQKPTKSYTHKKVKIEQVKFLNGNDKEVSLLETGQQATIRICYRAEERVERPIFGLAIHSSDGVHINGPNTDISKFIIEAIEGTGVIEYRIASLPLLGGSYKVTVGIFDPLDMSAYDYRDQAFEFTVSQRNSEEIYGVVYMPASWRHTPEDVATHSSKANIKV